MVMLFHIVSKTDFNLRKQASKTPYVVIELFSLFFRRAQAFYVEKAQKFPFKDETQTHSFMDPEKRDNIQAESGIYHLYHIFTFR